MRVRIVIGIAVAVVIAVTLRSDGTSVARTVTTSLAPLAPVADAYVDASAPRQRFGTRTTLSAAGVPVMTSYLRFDVAGVTGATTRATLSVSPAAASTAGFSVRGVASNSWAEGSINYRNAPAPGAIVASTGAFAAGRVSIDVTALVSGNGPISLAITSTSPATISMPSREGGANGPRLQIDYSSLVTPAVTLATPAAGSTTNVAATRFTGAAGNVAGDSQTVTVNVHRGNDLAAPLEQLLTTSRSGATWTVDAQPALTDGVYTAQASQSDDSGDAGRSATATFTVDTVAPQPTLTQPSEGSTVTTARPVLGGAAGEATGDSASVAVDIFSGTTTSNPLAQSINATRTGSSWSASPSAPLANGVYTARATQLDAAGNSGRSATRTFEVNAVTTTAYRDTILADTPRGYWRLGESSGTVAADAAASSAGVYQGGVALGQAGAISGDPDTAAGLDGVNDTVRIPNVAGLNSATALSLEALVRPGPLPSVTSTLMRKDQQYMLRITSQGNLIFRLWKGGSEHQLSTAAGVIVADSWSHVVAAYDGVAMRIYVNGRSRASLDLASPVDSGTRDLYLGASINYDWFAGRIDDVAVYTKALSAVDAQRHFGAAGIVDATPSAVKLETPENGAVWDAGVTSGGSAGADAGDEPAVTVSVYAGTAASGTPLRTLTAGVRSAGTFSVLDAAPLPGGTYTARATQRDGAGNVGASQASTFSVQPSGDPHLLAAGDVAACDTTGDEATAEVLDRLPGTLAVLGDLVYEYASAADYANCYDPTWGRQLARSRPVPGSHDYAEGRTNAEDYFAYFGPAAGLPARGYYSYNLGTWHVIALNSNCSEVGGCGAGSAQEQWLRADLAANPGVCTVAYWHDLRFSSGSIHGSNTGYQAFWQALYDFNADLILGSHEHVYERFGPQTPTGAADAARGIRQITVGTGGRSHYTFKTSVLANSQVRNADTFGILDVTLRPGSYEWRFEPEAGKTFSDSGSTPCH